jgi:hypothetical protein
MNATRQAGDKSKMKSRGGGRHASSLVPGSRAREDGGTEVSDVQQWPTDHEHAIREFVAWYCSEPRLAFNRTVVLRYRIHSNNNGDMRLRRSIYGSRPFGESRTRLPTPTS